MLMQLSCQRGFTLLEILIVLAIIAVMSGVVVLNVNTSNYSGFIAEANKIAATFEILGDEAVYTNSVIVCDINPDGAGVTCQSYKNGEWQDLNLGKLVSWKWPRLVRLQRVYVNGTLLKPGEKIRFYPNGTIPQMSFEISDGIHHAWVDGNLSGDFKVNN